MGGGMRHALGAVMLVLLAAGCGASATAGGQGETQLPEGFQEEKVAGGFTAPTAFAFLPDGRILVAEQSGIVRIVEDGLVLEQPFADLSDRVNDHRERGLLGLAVDPDFAANGFVYLLYTYENDPADYEGTKTARLTRLIAEDDVADPASETVVLGTNVGDSCRRFPAGSDCIPNDWMGHAVGDIAFASDGTLFASVGDASNWNRATADSLRAQDLDSLAGKIVHVTRDGEGLPSNPFWNGDPGAARSKVWAYGVRNAFRFALKPGTDVPYAGDVGWRTTEEIDVVEPGSNLGWPCYEGRRRQPEYEQMAACASLYAQGASAVRQPLVTWVQGTEKGEGASVTGGEFYVDGPYPRDMHGAYFYGDYRNGFIRYLQVDESDRVISGPTFFAEGVAGPVDIQVGPDGALYYLSIAAGELRRIVYTGEAQSGPSTERLFGRPSVYRAGANPHSVVTADVDGDGALDLVTALAGTDEVAVLLGDGDGGFGQASRFATEQRPKVAIAADLDADGVPDIASANQNSDSVSVLLGNGDGTFRDARHYPACSRPHDVAEGDLDADGDLDLAVPCLNGTVVSVLLGNADGTFGEAVDYESGESPHALVARDLDGDGTPDLAVANFEDNEVGVLIGNGDGTFRPVTRYGAGHHPHAIRAGDLNADGAPDLVTANDHSDDVSVLLGNGDGTFAEARSYPVGHVPKAVTVADVDGDGLDDVVAANTAGNYDDGPGHRGGDTVSVLLGDGSGALRPAADHLAGLTPFSVAVADVDGDGRAELITANWHGGTVSVLRPS